MTLEQWAVKTGRELAELAGVHGLPNGFGAGDWTGLCNTTCPAAVAGRMARRADLVARIASEAALDVTPKWRGGRFSGWSVRERVA